jgi:hypothetical protein
MLHDNAAVALHRSLFFKALRRHAKFGLESFRKRVDSAKFQQSKLFPLFPRARLLGCWRVYTATFIRPRKPFKAVLFYPLLENRLFIGPSCSLLFATVLHCDIVGHTTEYYRSYSYTVAIVIPQTLRLVSLYDIFTCDVVGFQAMLHKF